MIVGVARRREGKFADQEIAAGAPLLPILHPTPSSLPRLAVKRVWEREEAFSGRSRLLTPLRTGRLRFSGQKTLILHMPSQHTHRHIRAEFEGVVEQSVFGQAGIQEGMAGGVDHGGGAAHVNVVLL